MTATEEEERFDCDGCCCGEEEAAAEEDEGQGAVGDEEVWRKTGEDRVSMKMANSLCAHPVSQSGKCGKTKQNITIQDSFGGDTSETQNTTMH